MPINNISTTIAKTGVAVTIGYAEIASYSGDDTNITYRTRLYASLAAKTAGKDTIETASFKVAIADLDFAGTGDIMDVLTAHLYTIAPYSTGTVI